MKIKNALFMAVILSSGIFVLTGCPKKAEITALPQDQTNMETSPSAQAAAPGAESAQETAKTGAASEEPQERAAAPSAPGTGLKPVYFDFDRSVIRDDAKDALEADAAWLRANPDAKIRIEGNCDDRGTSEYNQALGQRRAASAKRYLAALGIADSRVSLVSYGKEKPVCAEQTEECRQNNRRGDLVVAAE